MTTKTPAAATPPAKRTRTPKHEGCGCDLDFREDPTSDEDLPPAAGGVEGDEVVDAPR